LPSCLPNITTRGIAVAQHTGDQLRELAVSQDCRLTEIACLYLIQDFARRGQGLDKNGLLIAYAIRDEVKISQGQR